MSGHQRQRPQPPQHTTNATADNNGVVQITRGYIDRMIDSVEDGTMKVLILDATTTQIVASVYSQTEILKRSVYLVRSLTPEPQQQSPTNYTTTQRHLHAIIYCRPTSLDDVVMELSRQRHGSYHIFFSAPVNPQELRRLAEADVSYESVTAVYEYYADAIPINRDLWSLQARGSLAMSISAGTSWAVSHATNYERHLSGLASMLLALRRSGLPNTVRYASHSAAAEEMARDLVEQYFETNGSSGMSTSSSNNNSGSGHGRSKQLTLLILDRRDDPVTPLLSQWTYQAMVHELLGLNNHRVSLRGAIDIAKDLEEVVLSDDFFTEHKYKNFGELGEEIQRLLQDYQRQTKQTANTLTSSLNTVADMQVFMDQFPELRSRQHTVSKHVAIMGELARLVESCRLFDVSVLEQNLACHDDHSAHWRDLMGKLNDPGIKVPDKLRLGMLYALRYENSANLHMLLQAMSKGGVPPHSISLVKSLLRYGGSKSRGPGLFHNGGGDIMSRVTKNIVGAVQGIDNVYSQHEPLVMDTLQMLLKGKLSARDYPVAYGNSNAVTDPINTDDVLIFMVGGVTYEEAYKIAEYNKSLVANSGGSVGSNVRPQIILAGSTVHNSTSFLDELKVTGL
jgi:vacuolar protein sorting-associated protein 45